LSVRSVIPKILKPVFETSTDEVESRVSQVQAEGSKVTDTEVEDISRESYCITCRQAIEDLNFTADNDFALEQPSDPID